MNVTLEQLARGKKRHKYGARKTEVDGIVFDSAAEARRYGQLKLLQRAGAISGLTLQPSFDCVVNGRLITEDSKGFRTPVYRIKKKLVEALYPIQIRETK